MGGFQLLEFPSQNPTYLKYAEIEKRCTGQLKKISAFKGPWKEDPTPLNKMILHHSSRGAGLGVQHDCPHDTELLRLLWVTQVLRS